jgi:hypothetical protein
MISFMAKRDTTNLYLSIDCEQDNFIDLYRKDLISRKKRTFTKNEVAKIILSKGIEVVNGNYIKTNPQIDSFVEQMQVQKIEVNGQEIVLKKSKQQIYEMLIEKGIQSLGE